MRRTRDHRSSFSFLLPLALLGVLSGCGVHLATWSERESMVLRTQDTPEGEVVYSLESGGGVRPVIQRKRIVLRDRARLGVVVRSIDLQLAESRGLEAWRGVLIERVREGSPAGLAGLREGDVMLSLAGEELSSRDQLEDLLDQGVRPGEEVRAVVLRPRSSSEGMVAGGAAQGPSSGDGAPDDGSSEQLASDHGASDRGASDRGASERGVSGQWASEHWAQNAGTLAAGSAGRLDLSLVPTASTERRHVSDPSELATSRLVYFLTGASLGGVQRSLAREALELDEPVVVVAGVQTGSPAYFAGLRMGDRILRCDDRPVDEVADVHAAVLARARRRGLRLDGVVDGVSPAQLEGAQDEGPLVLELDGPLGPHRAEVELDDAMDAASDFHIPILLGYHDDLRRKKVSFLDFIFQFGFNYRRVYQPSETREPELSTHFSLLPFGMFEFTTTPTTAKRTFFWFISSKSDR